MLDADTMHTQAMDLYKAGSVKESTAEFEKARQAFIEQGDKLKAAVVGNDLGVVYYLQGRLDEARRILTEVRGVFEQAGDVRGQARAIGNLAQLMNRAGEKDAAETNYLRAADLFHQAGDTQFEFDTYRALSQMQLQRGRVMEALLAYDQGLAAKGDSSFLRWFLQIPLKLAGLRK